jgi:hypothetical protein
MDPNDHSVLYAGTGEGYGNLDEVRGNGIYVTTSAGDQWDPLKSTLTPDFSSVQKLLVSPRDSKQLYAATSAGVFVSYDRGISWNRMVTSAGPLDAAPVNGCTDLALQTSSRPAYLFVACGNRAQGTVYRVADSAAPQVLLPVLSRHAMQRISIAIAPSRESVVYAMAAMDAGEGAAGLLGVFRSDSAGQAGTWSIRNKAADKLNRVLLSNPVQAYASDCFAKGLSVYLNQEWYGKVLGGDTQNPNAVMTGGVAV